MGRDVYIYGLVDPRTNVIRYVGKSIDYKGRFRDHISSAKNNVLIPVYSWIRKLLKNQLFPEIVILEVVKEDNWKEAEQKWIDYFSEQKPPLCNMFPASAGSDFSYAERGEDRYNCKLTENDVVEMRQKRADGAKLIDLANQYKVHVGTISLICRGKAWSHAGGPITQGMRTDFVPPPSPGSKHKLAKLTEDQVKEIVYLYKNTSLNQSEIAHKFNVKQALVWLIINGKSWVSVTEGKITSPYPTKNLNKPVQKLTLEKVRAIRSQKTAKSVRELAIMYDVSQNTIRDILDNRTWKSVE